MTFTRVFAFMALAGLVGSAHATNGMNMEGYGPIATGMGGASMAYDNGTAAMMNNPATLGLAADGNRFDAALGFLGPDVAVVNGQSSGGDAYFMPAIGWARKDGNLTYGVGMFAQGGMGTEFDNSMVMDGLPERSELGVGRLIAPLAFNVNPNLTIGGSIDFVWAMLDMRMAMPLGNMGAPAPGTMASLITVPPAGNLGMALGGFNAADNVRLDFSDGNDFTGKAKGYGMAGKLGFTYKISPMVSIGGTYHSKTDLGDMETSSSGANFVVNGVTAASGKIKVRDFQWPETYGLGVAVQATPELMVAVDYKRINWKDVMKNFTMTYEAMGDSVTFTLPQNWDDQDVFQIGVSYKATDALTLRAGASFADNPIPDATMHYLFPAIVENHYTVGLGYAINATSDVNFSLQHAPEVTQTNSTFGYTVSHEQTSAQLMYSKRF